MTPTAFRASRKRLGLTQTEMGRALLFQGAHIKAHIHRIEKGKCKVTPRIEALVRILEKDGLK